MGEAHHALAESQADSFVPSTPAQNVIGFIVNGINLDLATDSERGKRQTEPACQHGNLCPSNVFASLPTKAREDRFGQWYFSV